MSQIGSQNAMSNSIASPKRRALMMFAEVEGLERTATEGWNTTWATSNCCVEGESRVVPKSPNTRNIEKPLQKDLCISFLYPCKSHLASQLVGTRCWPGLRSQTSKGWGPEDDAKVSEASVALGPKGFKNLGWCWSSDDRLLLLWFLLFSLPLFFC